MFVLASITFTLAYNTFVIASNACKFACNVLVLASNALILEANMLAFASNAFVIPSNRNPLEGKQLIKQRNIKVFVAFAFDIKTNPLLVNCISLLLRYSLKH
jgi:hypothetical protein